MPEPVSTDLVTPGPCPTPEPPPVAPARTATLNKRFWVPRGESMTLGLGTLPGSFRRVAFAYKRGRVSLDSVAVRGTPPFLQIQLTNHDDYEECQVDVEIEHEWPGP